MGGHIFYIKMYNQRVDTDIYNETKQIKLYSILIDY